MMPEENSIQAFLLPSGGDLSSVVLQCVFLAVLFLLVVSTIIRVCLSARPANWSANWSGEDGQNSNGAFIFRGHGSVHDISSVVATPAEKTAVLLPGILLVIGLLGTFIGLGLALNNASSIVDHVSGSADTSSALTTLMPMMTNLGMKFKTSTWGILGFLLMNVFNTYNGFEKRRLAWVVSKVRSEVVKDQKEKLDRDREMVRRLGSYVETVGNQICGWLVKQEKSLQEISIANQDTSRSIALFLQTNAENINSMQHSALTMSQAAEKTGRAADKLASSVGEFDHEVKDVLQTVKRDLKETITAMDQGFREKVGEMSRNLKGATDGISTAVGCLSTEMKETMELVRGSVNDSLDLQRKALIKFSATVEHLQENVQASTDNLRNIASEIKQGLEAVSNIGRKMVSLGNDCRDVLKEVRELRTEMRGVGRAEDQGQSE